MPNKSYTIDEFHLRDQFTRLSPNWLERHGLGYNKIVYMHRLRGTLLVAIQQPREREGGNNFMMRTKGLEAFYRYEQEGKRDRKGGDNDAFTQINVFFVDRTFKFASRDYPAQHQIMFDGQTDTIDRIFSKVEPLRRKGKLYTIIGSDGLEIFFLDEDFEPNTIVGEDPDVEPRTRNGMRSRVNRSDPENQRSLNLKTTIDVKINVGEPEEFTITVPTSASELLELIEDQYGPCERVPF